MVLLVLALLLAGPVIALVALVRTSQSGSLTRRIAQLERRLQALQAQLAAPPGEAQTAAERPSAGVAPAPRSAADAAARVLEQRRPSEAPPVPAPATHAAAHDLEAPHVEAPHVEAPQVGAPQVDAPHVEAPALAGTAKENQEPATPAAPRVGPPGREGAGDGSRRRSVDWERWIGVRGFAVAGGAVLALAGILFFQFAIEAGWATPRVRFATGLVVGALTIAAGEVLRPRGYRFTPNALVGAGVVVLYAALWAAHKLYGLVSFELSFGAMALVTGAACWLAVRHRSQLVAVLALAGGFLTPVLLSSGENKPIGLFGYVLLLDLGLLLVGRKRGWSSLVALAVLGTAAMQGLWIFALMEPHQLPTGLVVLGVFALLFALLGKTSWQSRGGAVLFPFVFAAYFASQADLGPRLLPLAALAGLLCAAACVVARGDERQSWLPLGAASGTVGLFLLWIFRAQLDAALAWEAALCAAGLAAVLHAFAELEARRTPDRTPTLQGAAFASTFLLGILALTAAEPHASRLWPWLTGAAVLSALLARQSGFGRLAPLALLASLGTPIAARLYLGGAHGAGEASVTPPSAATIWIVAFATVLAAQAIPLAARRTDERARRWAWRAAACAALPWLAAVSTLAQLEEQPIGLALALALLLGLPALAAAARTGSGAWMALVAAALVLTYVARDFDPSAPAPASVPAVLATHLALAFVLASAPLPWRAWRAAAPAAWVAAALAPALLFFAARGVVHDLAGSGYDWLLALGFALAPLAALALVAKTWPAAEEPRERGFALAALALAATGLGAAVVPLALEHEWVVVALALWGLALAVVWRRLDRSELKYAALALFALATVGLATNLVAPGHYEHQSVRVVNWLAYVHLVPAAAMVGATAAFARLEVERARPGERPFYATGRSLVAGLCGLGAAVCTFVWFNVAILDWFATGPRIEPTLERIPTRDVALSIAWAVYALGLLGLGMATRFRGPRWTSLALLVATILKVFLHDLGELEGLFRVASLVGLATSLILVSLLYQRFVFGRVSAEPT